MFQAFGKRPRSPGTDIKLKGIPFPGPSPFFTWLARPFVRTAGTDDLALLPLLELPLTDFSGPTRINKRNLAFTQGAVNEGEQILPGPFVLGGRPNINALEIQGLYLPTG